MRLTTPFVDAEYMAYMLGDSTPNGFRGTAKGDANNGVLLLDDRPITVRQGPSHHEWFSTGALYVIEAAAASHRARALPAIERVALSTSSWRPLYRLWNSSLAESQRYAGEAIVSAGCLHSVPCVPAHVLEGACEIAHASVNVLQACSAVELGTSHRGRWCAVMRLGVQHARLRRHHTDRSQCHQLRAPNIAQVMSHLGDAGFQGRRPRARVHRAST